MRLNSDLENRIYRNTVEEVYQSILSDIAKAKELLTQTKWEKAYASSIQIVKNPIYTLENLNKDLSMTPNNYLSTESITALELVMNNSATVISPHFLKKYNNEDLRLTSLKKIKWI